MILSIIIVNCLFFALVTSSEAGTVGREVSQDELSRHNVLVRQSTSEYKTGLRVCFGQDSICDLYLDYSSNCSQKSGDDWYRCKCDMLAIDQACDDCENTYSMTIYSPAERWSTTCSSKGMTIAPIPSDVLAIQSSRNATLTELMTTETSINNPTSGISSERRSLPTSPVSANSEILTRQSSSKSSPSGTRSTGTTLQNFTETISMNGNPTGIIPTEEPTSSTTSILNVPGTSLAPKRNIKGALVFSIIAAVLVVFCRFNFAF